VASKKALEQLTITDKRMLIDVNHPELSAGRQCDLLGLSRSSWYYQARPESRYNEPLMRMMGLEAIYPKPRSGGVSQKNYAGKADWRDWLRIVDAGKVWLDVLAHREVRHGQEGLEAGTDGTQAVEAASSPLPDVRATDVDAPRQSPGGGDAG